MKAEIKLNQEDIKTAIREYVEREKSIKIKDVRLNYTPGTSDPRDYAYHSVTAVEE